MSRIVTCAQAGVAAGAVSFFMVHAALPGGGNVRVSVPNVHVRTTVPNVHVRTPVVHLNTHGAGNPHGVVVHQGSGYCPSCGKAGHRELQAQGGRQGSRGQQDHIERHAPPAANSHHGPDDPIGRHLQLRHDRARHDRARLGPRAARVVTTRFRPRMTAARVAEQPTPAPSPARSCRSSIPDSTPAPTLPLGSSSPA